jgi:PD-(D/E)XK nuclease superfamily
MQSVHLHAGGAWAKGLETAREAFYGDGLPESNSIGLGLEALITEYGSFDPGNSSKSLDRLIEAFAYYFSAFPLPTDPVQPYRRKDGKPMVEFSFALPLDINRVRHPVTGEPIIYSGRADMIATYAGAVSVYDDKTTSQLGDSWAKQWNRRSQFTGYAWAAREYGIPVSQVVVRGIAILKTMVKHAEAITLRTPHHVAEWHEQACRDILRAIEAWKSGYWDVNLAEACSAYGGCLFMQPCMSSNPEPWLTGGNYSVRVWNPLTRKEEENV